MVWFCPCLLGVLRVIISCERREIVMAARLSGVQREVNQLYRRLLRAAKLKDGGGWAGSTTELVRAEFRSQVWSKLHIRVSILHDHLYCTRLRIFDYGLYTRCTPSYRRRQCSAVLCHATSR